MSNERRIVTLALALAALVAVVLGALALPGHGLTRATGAAAITLLLVALAASPIARLVPPVWAVPLRGARRRVGIASALVAAGHAVLALASYLSPLALGPLLALPWLRHGAIALAILVALLLTSFPVLQRALRVRAWSALHRLAYVAGVFGALHAAGVPFGSVYVGLTALSLLAILLLARPLALLLGRRPRPDAD